MACGSSSGRHPGIGCPGNETDPLSWTPTAADPDLPGLVPLWRSSRRRTSSSTPAATAWARGPRTRRTRTRRTGATHRTAVWAYARRPTLVTRSSTPTVGLGVRQRRPSRQGTTVTKRYQTKTIDTSALAVPERVSVAMADVAEDMREGLLALAVGAGLQVMAALMEADVSAVDGSGELPVPSYEVFTGTEVMGAMALERM